MNEDFECAVIISFTSSNEVRIILIFLTLNKILSFLFDGTIHAYTTKYLNC
jgi:hypothetical protein